VCVKIRKFKDLDTYHQYFVYLERDKETLEEALHKGLIDWEETK
jgi:hypothetical protein